VAVSAFPAAVPCWLLLAAQTTTRRRRGPPSGRDKLAADGRAAARRRRKKKLETLLEMLRSKGRLPWTDGIGLPLTTRWRARDATPHAGRGPRLHAAGPPQAGAPDPL